MSDVDEFDDAEFDFEEGDDDGDEEGEENDARPLFAPKAKRRSDAPERSAAQDVEAAPPPPVTPKDVDEGWRAWKGACLVLGLPPHAADVEAPSGASRDAVLEATLMADVEPVTYMTARVAEEIAALVLIAEDPDTERSTIAFELANIVHRAEVTARMQARAVAGLREALSVYKETLREALNAA